MSSSKQMNFQRGNNELNKRDLNRKTLMYGTIDRWIMYSKDEKNILMNTSNRKNFEVGEVIKMSETLFAVWLKLLTFVDGTSNRKTDGHVKSSTDYIARNLLGYADSSGMYKVLHCLYEIGLIDINDSEFNGKDTVDVIVYEYPVYADSDICTLVKCRKWEDRKSKGMLLSKKGVAARKKKTPVEKSQQVKKQEPVEKSQQEPVEKSQQEPVEKSQHTNSLNISNSLNILIPHLVDDSRFNDTEKKQLNRFILEQKIDDDDLIIKFLDRIYENPPKTRSYKKYFVKVLDSVKNTREKPVNNPNKPIRKEVIPNFMNEQKDDTEQNEASKQHIEISEVVKVFSRMNMDEKKIIDRVKKVVPGASDEEILEVYKSIE